MSTFGGDGRPDGHERVRLQKMGAGDASRQRPGRNAPARHREIDRTAIERSRQAARQLADVGIKLGGYKLEPPLGGKLLRNPGQSAR